MKKVLSVFLALSSFAGVCHAKTDSLIYNQNEKCIEISGAVESGLQNKKIKIIVTNPGFTIESLKNDFENALYYVNEVYTSDNGSYEIIIPISEDTISGEYSLYVQDDEGEKPEKLSLYYADSEEKEEIIIKINNAEKEEIKGILSEAVKILSLDKDLVQTVIDKTAVLLYDYKEETPLKTEDAKNVIEGLAIVAAFNEGKSDLLFKDGVFSGQGILDFSLVDKNGANLYTIYEEKMSEKGKIAVIDGLYGKNLKNIDELLNKFAENVFINAIKCPELDGTGHISEVLTKKNADAVGISVDSYLNIKNNTQKKNTELDLMSETFATVKELEERLSDIVSSNKQQNGGSFGGGSGGGGSSMGGMGSLIVTPIENGEKAETENKVFLDMADVSWAEEAVNYLYKKGIVSGTGNNMFSPQKAVTREQFAVMLINSLGTELLENDGKFSDVLAGSYYEKHVATGVKSGIINGISENVFGTGKNITREDLCTLIFRAYFADELSEGKLNFSDNSDVSDYALTAVSSLATKGIVNGFSDGSFRPKGVCTRAQAAKILYGAMKFVENNK